MLWSLNTAAEKRCSITLSTYPVCRPNGALHVAEGGKIELPSVCLALRLVHAAARHLRGKHARRLMVLMSSTAATVGQCRTLNSSIRSRTSFDSMFLGRFPRSMEKTGGGGGSGTAHACMGRGSARSIQQPQVRAKSSARYWHGNNMLMRPYSLPHRQPSCPGFPKELGPSWRPRRLPCV